MDWWGRKLARSGILPKDAVALNLDTIGSGPQAYVIQGNGLIRRTRTSTQVNLELLRCVEGLGAGPRLWWAALAGHDHIPFIRAGMRATTLSMDAREDDKLDRLIARLFRLPNARVRKYRHLHAPDDLPEQIDLKSIELSGGWCSNS